MNNVKQTSCVATAPSPSQNDEANVFVCDAGGCAATQNRAAHLGVARLLAAFVMALCAVALDAAQCEGLTKAGVRCKREATENSKYCIGHADQAKAPKAEKLKDDGTCWAVTEAGTRCKHKKDGESDYCKQHAADKKPSKPQKQCRALKWDGQRCERAPQPDCCYCKQHAKFGATPGAVSPRKDTTAEAQATAKENAKSKKETGK